MKDSIYQNCGSLPPILCPAFDLPAFDLRRKIIWQAEKFLKFSKGVLGWPKRVSVGTGDPHRQEAKSWTLVSEVGDKHAHLRGAENTKLLWLSKAC